MPSCTACQNRPESRPELLWKSLPRKRKDSQIKKLWLSKLKRKDGTSPKEENIVLCSEHFADDCFERDVKKEFEQGTGEEIYKIKDGAIPTIFKKEFDQGTSGDVSTPRVYSKARKQRAEKRKIIDDILLTTPVSTPMLTSPTSIEVNEACDSGPSLNSSDNNSSSSITITKNTDDCRAFKRTYCDMAVNTDMSFSPYSNISFFHDFHDESEESSDQSDKKEYDEDICLDDYKEMSESEADDVGREYHGMKFLVYFTCLLPLLRYCFTCSAAATIFKSYTIGSTLCIKLLCPNKHVSTWYSQPKEKDIFLGNVEIASSIVFSGGTFKQFEDMSNILRLQIMNERTFYRLQSKYIFGAINKVHKEYRGQIVSLFSNSCVSLSGDGRHDSPGHNAKFCTYSVMDQTLSQIVHFHVVCVAETEGKSNLMEKQGLINVLKKLDSLDVSIKSLTTDRHSQIKKYIREDTNIRHQFDVWHAAKGIRGKITTAAKKKENSDLQKWIKSIVNHFWWCCSSSNGNLEELTEKWLSILFHICNIHEFPENKVFKRCLHGNIEREWLSADSSSFLALKKIITSTRFISDLKYFVDFLHTGNLEVFHSLLLKYCPKRIQFGMSGMICRTQLAVLHFNDAMKCKHAQTKDGAPRFKTQLSKMSKQFVAKPIKTAPEKKYLQQLMVEAKNMIHHPFSHKPVIPNLPTIYEVPDKQEVISKMYTRFSI